MNEWVERWQAGIDMEESFRRIFEKYYRLVFSFFAKRGFSTEESEDLVQETFLRIHKSLATFRRESSFETWLFQVTANVWRNTLRSQSTRKRDADEVPIDEAMTSGPARAGRQPSAFEEDERGPLERLLASEASDKLREALDDMPPQMRRCVLLRVDQDLKYREIAELMRVSIDTVKAHLFQARQILKKKLGDYFDDPKL